MARKAKAAVKPDPTAAAMKQGQAQLASILEMVAALALAEAREEADGYEPREAAERAIHEDALTVEVRSDWYLPGSHVRGENGASKPAEYRILLCTGGPACRIVGNLSGHGEPETAELQVQDWGTPWTRLPTTGDEQDAMLAYARCFYFGE